ncbi:DUF2092 domain-containing protein [Thermopolyspora sp. NPDC052614]|uniref:LolA family protein n=1 Tax=Thermopolyspora sp. NPDC052614 TaxID=3155682 RepID=UPI0034383AF0
MRWGVPVVAVAVVGAAVGAGPVIAAVQGDPTLPERTAEQLLADLVEAGRSGTVPPLSGTVVETASLGLPALTALGGSESSPASLLGGVNQIKVWYGGAGKVRLALPGRMSETDLIINGDQVWLWESATNTATRFKTPDVERRGGKDTEGHGPLGGRPSGTASPLPTTLTPQELARQVLEKVDDDTAVSVTNTERVAGRAAYQLVIAPKDEASLVKEIRLAVDGETLVPLRVQILADGATEPALEVGFSSVTFTPPASEMFAFTPPAGAKVTEKTPDAARKGHEASDAEKKAEHKAPEGVKRIGEGWTTIVSVPMTERELLSGDRPGGKGPQGDSAEARQARENAQQLLKTVLASAKPVSGAWGSGKVIETKLVSILITDDGRVLAGAVTPEALVEAAGKK